MQPFDPNKFFETQKDGAMPVSSATVTLGVGNNQTVIAAVTSKIILVLGVTALTNTGTWNLKNGSGGAALMFGPVAAIQNFQRPFNKYGYFRTSSGTGLFADVATATVNFTIEYIAYTP